MPTPFVLESTETSDVLEVLAVPSLAGISVDSPELIVHPMPVVAVSTPTPTLVNGFPQ